jgi:hypothetical protein
LKEEEEDRKPRSTSLTSTMHDLPEVVAVPSTVKLRKAGSCDDILSPGKQRKESAFEIIEDSAVVTTISEIQRKVTPYVVIGEPEVDFWMLVVQTQSPTRQLLHFLKDLYQSSLLVLRKRKLMHHKRLQRVLQD